LRNPQDALPIGAVLPDIQAAAAEAPTLVIVAPPDAGKTTRALLALRGAAWGEGRQAHSENPLVIA
jgi:ATP-dependent helicase HrpB